MTWKPPEFPTKQMAQTKTRQSGASYEKRINHCVRATRMKRHQRNATGRETCINMRARANAHLRVRVYGWGPGVEDWSSCNPTATDTTMSHPGCSRQAAAGGNSWEASASHITATVPGSVCWHKCNQQATTAELLKTSETTRHAAQRLPLNIFSTEQP